jgi:hypothetical protein
VFSRDDSTGSHKYISFYDAPSTYLGPYRPSSERSFTKEYIYNTCWPVCAITYILASSKANTDTSWTAFIWTSWTEFICTSRTEFICTSWTEFICTSRTDFIINMFISKRPSRRGTVGADIRRRSVTSNKNLQFKLQLIVQSVCSNRILILYTSAKFAYSHFGFPILLPFVGHS